MDKLLDPLCHEIYDCCLLELEPQPGETWDQESLDKIDALKRGLNLVLDEVGVT